MRAPLKVAEVSLVVLWLIGFARFGESRGSAPACSCLPARPDTLAARSEAVFIGVPIRERVLWERVDRPTLGRQRVPVQRTYRFRVLYSWKEPDADGSFLESLVTKLADKIRRLAGVEGRILTVRTGGGGGDCGFVFKEGEYYLVFAGPSMFWPRPLDSDSTWSSDQLWTGLCSGTTRLAESGYDQLMLGPPSNDYRLPEDSSITLVTAGSLSQEQKEEILAEAGRQVTNFFIKVAGRDEQGNYELSYRPNRSVAWVPAGVFPSNALDQGDWNQVTRQLKQLIPHLWKDYEGRDWHTLAIPGR